MKTWDCTATCGFKTTSARGWKQHAETCEKRRDHLQALEQKIRSSPAGQAMAGLGIDIIDSLRSFTKAKS